MSIRDNTLPEELKSLERDLAEFRSRQILAGDSLKIYNTYSNDDYDFVSTVTAFDWRYYEVTFTPDYARTQTILSMTAFRRDDNTDVMGGTLVKAVVQERVPTPNRKFELWLYNGDSVSHDIYVKFFFTGTATGNWSLQEI